MSEQAPINRRQLLARGGAAAAGLAATGVYSSLPAWARTFARSSTALRRPGSLPFPHLPAGHPTPGLEQIEHVVVLMMENHSFDNLLGMVPHQVSGRAKVDGLTVKGGRVVNSNPSSVAPYAIKGPQVTARLASSPCQESGHPTQAWNASHLSWNNGQNNGFVQASTAVAMWYWDKHSLPTTYSLAQHYPIGQRYFCSVLAQTYPNRRFLVAGTAAGIISTSSAALLSPPPPNGTIFDRLDAHGITWRDYYNDLPGLAVIPSIVTGNRSHQTSPTSQFITDAAAGKLPDVSYVDPNFSVQSEEDPQDIRQGERFAAAIINAAMQGPKWSKTLLIWTYDEHGGYYDHVPPPRAIRPDNIPPEIKVPPDLPGAYDRYGFRVPAVIVSPYARKNYVSHVVHDHTSVMKLIETKWNLGALTYRDANADNLLDSVDFKSKPAFLEPPTLPAPALPASVEIDTSSQATDHCIMGEPGGPIPPPSALVPLSEASKLRVGAT
jgi:phospholipase C